MSKDSKAKTLFGREEYGFPCSNGISRLPDRARPSSTAEGRIEQQHDVEIEEGDKREAIRKIRGPWVEIFSDNEELRSKLYDPDNETFLISLTYVNVMRQILASINKLSETIINDVWVEAKGVNLSEVCLGTTRFQILRARLLEGNNWVNCRLSKLQKTTRPYSTFLEARTRPSKSQKGKSFASRRG